MSNPDLTLSYSSITVPRGNYAASSLVSTIEPILQTRFPDYGFSCIYSNYVGISEISNSNDLGFRILTDGMALSLQGDTCGVGQAMLEWYGSHVA